MFEKLGKFEITKRLGQGAMGEVYLGTDPSIGRPVAIKTILASAAQGEEAKARFGREARAAGVLNHPNLVTIYEFGEDQGVLFIAMEYVQGHDLEELLRDQALTQAEALEVLAQVCDGLAFAHRAGIVHRDVKPSNVRVTRDGRRLHAKVMDFGVARVSDSDMTATGMVMGTVSYMAPEYIRTGRPDARSDLFAVGVMLYEMLSGRKPFSGDTTPTILYRIVNEAPEPLDASQLRGISPAIRSVLDRALDKDPERRFQTGEELAKALRAAKDPTWQGQVENGTVRLGAAPTAAVPAAPEPTAAVPLPPPMAAPVRRRRSLAPLLAFVGVAAVAGGGYGAWRAWPLLRARLAGQPATPLPTEALPGATPSVASPSASAPGTGLATPGTSGAPAPASATPTSSAPAGAQAAGGADPSAGPQAEAAPERRPVPSQERLEQMEVHERKNAGHMSYNDAMALADSNPNAAIEGFRDVLAIDPTNRNAYAWCVALMYEQGRYREIPGVLARARRHGISRAELAAANLRLRMAFRKDEFNRRIPDAE
jgi:serine/threonine-protein kinase